MTRLTDDHLAQLALTLEAEQDRTRCWTSPPRLLALPPLDPAALDAALAAGLVPWRRLGEGNPYHLLATAPLDPPDAPAIALVVHGWAFPPDDPSSWYGRPSQHPGRVRIRTAAIVTADGRDCSALRMLHGDVKVVTDGGGRLMEAMLGMWARPATPTIDPPPTVTRSRRPAHCRRDHR